MSSPAETAGRRLTGLARRLVLRFGEPVRFGVEIAVTAVQAARGFGASRVFLRGAALTYLSVVSLVPFLAVVLYGLQAFDFFHLHHAVRDFVFENLAVGARETVAAQLDELVANAGQSGVVSVGFLLLVASSVLLLRNIEHAFDDLWGVHKTRPWYRQVPLYVGLLFAGPIALGVSLALTAALRTFAELHHVPAEDLWIGALPLGVSAAAFTVLYKIAPAAKVRWRPAIGGGLLAAVVWELAKHLYATYAATALRADAIYGPLGALPLFLIWIYVSWIVALFGARVAYAIQHPEGVLLAGNDQEAARAEELCAMRLAVACAAHQARGGEALGTHELAITLRYPEGMIRRILSVLEDDELVRMVGARRVELARDARAITLGDVLRAVRGRIRPPETEDDPVGAELAALLSEADESGVKALAGRDLATLARLDEPLAGELAALGIGPPPL